MSHVDCLRKTKVSRSIRARQVQSMFDVPCSEYSQLQWSGNVPLDEKPWSVGLIVGPSGSGKSTVASELFKKEFTATMNYNADSVLDDFHQDLPLDKIVSSCSSVGFNTVPAWLRPYAVLSNGEKFRVDLARRILELPDPVVVDEFTSVVDRQVAKIGSHAVAKFVRKNNRKFVAISCHEDVEEWLQPDWVLEPASMSFRWRLLRRRPQIEIKISRVKYDMWKLFAPYHYLTSELSKAAKCFCAFVDDRPVAFVGILHYPHPKNKLIKKISRVVTLPDWQGVGIAFVLMENVASYFKSLGFYVHINPANPSLVRSFDRNLKWQLRSKPGAHMQRTSSADKGIATGRNCATFRWIGPAAEKSHAIEMVHG